MIQNPTKKITINKSVDYVMTRLQHLGAWTGKQMGITIVEAHIDKNFNTYSFKSKAIVTDSLVDMGNFGNVSLNPIGSDKCELTIEMGKNFGCISNQFEAQDCNSQISAFLNILSSLINKNESEITNYPKSSGKVSKSATSTNFVTYACAILGMFIAMLFFAII